VSATFPESVIVSVQPVALGVVPPCTGNDAEAPLPVSEPIVATFVHADDNVGVYVRVPAPSPISSVRFVALPFMSTDVIISLWIATSSAETTEDCELTPLALNTIENV